MSILENAYVNTDIDYKITGPFTHENLAIYLVRGESQLGFTPLTLQEALLREVIKVRETGDVNELTIENLGMNMSLFNQENWSKAGNRTGF